MSAVVSLGSVNADFLVRVPQPPSGQGSLTGDSLLRTSGGKGANVAVLAARLGTPARLLGCVGDDDLAALALQGPEAAGVNLRGVRRRRGPSGYSSALVAPDGTGTVVLVPNANDAWAEDASKVAAEVDAAPDGSVLVVDLEVPGELVAAALSVARERGFLTVLDPTPSDRLAPELYALVDHLTLSQADASRLTGADLGPEAALELRKRGPAVVHVRLTEGGCVTATAEGAFLVEAPADIPVVDATGAGDAFAGALAVALVRGRSAVQAAEFGVAAATCAIGAYGAQESYPNPAALAAMLARVTSRQL